MSRLADMLAYRIGQDDSSKRPEMKLNVPEALKVLLVDDWEAVTKNNQVRQSMQCGRPRTLSLLHACFHMTLRTINETIQQLIALPRTPNVLQLLEDYKQYVLANASTLQ